MAPCIAHPNFFNEKSTGTVHGRLVQAFCCRHINFKTVFQSVSKYAIFIQKMWGGGTARSPDPSCLKTLPHLLSFGAYGALTLALNFGPFQTPKYATVSSVCSRVCLSLSDRDYTERLRAIFMKLCRIMSCYYEKNPLNFGVVPTQNGQMAAILDSCYHIYTIYVITDIAVVHITVTIFSCRISWVF